MAGALRGGLIKGTFNAENQFKGITRGSGWIMFTVVATISLDFVEMDEPASFSKQCICHFLNAAG